MTKQNQEQKLKEAAGFTAGGSALGAALAGLVGNMGLAGGFGAVAVGSAPIVAARAIAMAGNEQITVGQICKTLGISRDTYHRYSSLCYEKSVLDCALSEKYTKPH